MKTWRSVRLGEICKLINGRAYKQQELLAVGKYPVLRVGNFFSNRSWYYSDLELDADKYCDTGDLLYAWSASFGPKIWNGVKVVYHYHIWKTALDDSKVDKMFLYYWFGWDSERIRSDHGAGTTMIHVTKGSMEERKILLPPLDEQRRIVAILDEIFEGINAAAANAERNLSSVRELFDNYVCAAFSIPSDGWLKTTLGTLCNTIEYGTATKSLPEGRVPVLRMGNIQNGNLNWDDLVYTDDVAEIRKYSLKPGDVLFNRTNSAEHVGKAAIYRGEKPAIFAGYLIRIHHKKDYLDGEFLNYFLNSSIARNYGKTVMSQSVNQANISGSKLKDYPIAIPPLSEQREIVAKLHRLKALASDLLVLYQRKLEELQELKLSILEKAFAGELSVKAGPLLEEALA